MIALLLLLTGCTYDEAYSCEPWQGWWSGTLSGDLEATLVGEFYAYYAGALVPAGGAILAVDLRGVELGPVLGLEESVVPSSASASAALENGQCESAWRGALALSSSVVVVASLPGGAEDTDTGVGDTGDTGLATTPSVGFSGSMVGELTDPEADEAAGGGGTWEMTGPDGQSLAGEWSLVFDGDFPSAAE